MATEIYDQEKHDFAMVVQEIASSMYKLLFAAMRNALTADQIEVADLTKMEIEFYNLGLKLAKYAE